MKQFFTAIAAFLAASASAERPFKLETTFDNEDEICLAVEVGNPVTLKLPRTKPPHDMCIECDGWVLAPWPSFTDFTVMEMTVGKRTSFLIEAS